MNTHEGI